MVLMIMHELCCSFPELLFGCELSPTIMISQNSSVGLTARWKEGFFLVLSYYSMKSRAVYS